MSTSNPIWVDNGEKYDSSICCERSGALPTPWWVTVKITPVSDPGTVVAEWHGPHGHASYEAAKKAGLEQARALVFDLEKEEYRVP